jgi:hypothetical protein
MLFQDNHLRLPVVRKMSVHGRRYFNGTVQFSEGQCLAQLNLGESVTVFAGSPPAAERKSQRRSAPSPNSPFIDTSSVRHIPLIEPGLLSPYFLIPVKQRDFAVMYARGNLENQWQKPYTRRALWSVSI